MRGSVTERRKTRRRRSGAKLLLLSVAVTCALALAGGLLAWRNYTDQRDRVVSNVQAHAESVADDTERFFNDRIRLLRTVTQFPALRSGNARAIQNILNEVETSRVGFTGGLGWVDAQGQLQASGSPGSVLPVDLSDRDYVRASLDSDIPYVGRINIGRVLPGPVVGISAPTRGVGGQVNGALIGTLRLDRLDESDRDLPIRDRQVVVVDRDNRIVIREGEVPPSIETLSSSLIDDARAGASHVLAGRDRFQWQYRPHRGLCARAHFCLGDPRQPANDRGSRLGPQPVLQRDWRLAPGGAERTGGNDGHRAAAGYRRGGRGDSHR